MKGLGMKPRSHADILYFRCRRTSNGVLGPDAADPSENKYLTSAFFQGNLHIAPLLLPTQVVNLPGLGINDNTAIDIQEFGLHEVA